MDSGQPTPTPTPKAREWQLDMLQAIQEFRENHPEEFLILKEAVKARGELDRSDYAIADDIMKEIAGRMIDRAMFECAEKHGDGFFFVTGPTWDLIKSRCDIETHQRITEYNGVRGYTQGCVILVGPAPRWGFRWVPELEVETYD